MASSEYTSIGHNSATTEVSVAVVSVNQAGHPRDTFPAGNLLPIYNPAGVGTYACLQEFRKLLPSPGYRK